VTPWFAAGAGFVIAAALWIHSPHAELRFPPIAGGVMQCKIDGCGPADSNGSGSLAASTPGQRLVHSHHADGKAAGPDSARHPDRAAGLKFQFTLLWQRHGSFGALISVLGKPSLGSWRLAFTMPGATIKYVKGADWQPLPSGDGGTAWATRQHGSFRHAPGATFTVIGSGTATTPASCRFDGSKCRFS
jgi:hypothetical protein